MAHDRKAEPLPWVLARHLDRMSAKMLDSKDAYPDLGRELVFFVGLGYDEFLAKDLDFTKLWRQYLQDVARGVQAAPRGVVFQTWRYYQDQRILRKASGIYSRLLPGWVGKTMAWDSTPVETDEVAA